MCDPILVTPLKMRPPYSQSSRENATPSSGTSPLASYKEVTPPGVGSMTERRSRQNARMSLVIRIQPISLCKPCLMSVRGPNNVGTAVQTDATLLRYASTITEQKKCWELLAESLTGFKLCATTHNNNIQKHATGCANGRNM